MSQKNNLHLKNDLRSSVVVFLVALPLAMGISIASGYPPIAGIITGIVGGVLVGLMSGAPLQVSGAAAGLTVVVFQGVQQFGIEKMGLAILIAGLFQIIAAVSGLGRWFQAVSPTVLYAMLAGIGVLIVASQFHVMLDLTPKGNGLQNMQAVPESIQSVFANLTSSYAMILGVMSIAIMILWPKVAKGKLKVLPAPLVAVIACSIVAGVAALPVKYVNIPEDLLKSWQFANLDMSMLRDTALIALGLKLALIASAESLLCAAALDQMHSGPRAKFNKELAAQGVGNAICGLLGVLPMTGVIVRSSANIDSGARSRASTIFHGLWLLLFVLVFPNVLAFIPISALAGILVFTGVKLVNVKEIKLLYSYGRAELFIYGITVAVVVSYDLLYGVLLGLAISSLKLLLELSHLKISFKEGRSQKETVIEMHGAATFLRLPKFAAAFDRIQAGAIVNVRSDLQLVDPACFEHFRRWKKRHEEQGGRVEVQGRQLA